MKEKRKKCGTACDLCRHQKKKCRGGSFGEESCNSCISKRKRCSYLRNSSECDPSHNDVSQLQTDKSPEFLSPGDISQMSFDFNAFVESPEVTNIQPNFDESPELASFIDAPQFQNRFKLTELTNTDGHQIYPEYAYSFHKTNILQVSQVLQQLSNLDLILSENQVMQSQVLSSLNESNLRSSRMANALQDRSQNWANSQSRTNEVTNINAQEATNYQMAPANQNFISDYYWQRH
ncbi:hypothetical protein C2G38_2259943 [Gigaspora rosea]|uniref:Zn(2)-C6 fungal-type domain-containing protein n=1 Tax=Gigaspora rosea TaxID=44941 RepID=A0A397VZ88_9GLOM|nr:hypothetical protein C2G38_2259943 [Gigaspora rosea]